MRRRGGTLAKLTAVLIAAALALLVLAQVVLPQIATSTIRSRVGRYGSVAGVRVSAWPAIELLWGAAGSVHVDADRLSIAPRQIGDLLWAARGTDTLDVTAAHVDLGGLQIAGATLSKQGSELSAGGVVSAAAVDAALPAGVSVKLLRSSPEGVLVQVSGGLFGTRRPLRALAAARGGKLVVRPLAAALAGAQLTLFSDPRIAIEGVGAQATGPARSPSAYFLTIRGRMR
jgi:hypothetical protein